MFLWYIEPRKLQIKIVYKIWIWLEVKNADMEIVSDILLRAASEPNFRRLLFSEPSKVLEDYDLSSEAKSIIVNVINDFK